VKPHDRSWQRLIAFLAIITIASSLTCAAVLAGFTVAVADSESPHVTDDQSGSADLLQTFTGMVTDKHCGSRHTDSEHNAADCIRMCVRNGSRYKIVDGDRNYEVAGNLSQLDQFAGQRVTLSGVLDGGTIKVSSVSGDLQSK
jgi:hypothetical protein